MDSRHIGRWQAGFLFLYALFIWIRDLVWLEAWDEALFHLFAFPAFFWMASPWIWDKSPIPNFSKKSSWIALILFFLGSFLDLTLLFTFSWTILAADFFKRVWTSPVKSDINALCTLFILGFPWLDTDGRGLGWYFRLSNAYFSEKLLAFTNIHVEREGTFLFVSGVPISIEEACSGLKSMQVMLLAGLLINYLFYRGTKLFWLNIPWIFVVGWFSNLIRILFFVLVAISAGSEYAEGLFHLVGGTVLVAVTLLLLVVLFWIESRGKASDR